MTKTWSSILITIIISGILSCTPNNIIPSTNADPGDLIGSWQGVQIKTIYSKNGIAVDSSIVVPDSNVSETMDINEDTICDKTTISGILQEIIYSYTPIDSTNKLALVLLENKSSVMVPTNVEVTYNFINNQLEFQTGKDNITAQESGGAYDKFERRTLYNRIP